MDSQAAKPALELIRSAQRRSGAPPLNTLTDTKVTLRCYPRSVDTLPCIQLQQNQQAPISSYSPQQQLHALQHTWHLVVLAQKTL
jgi:hypothetical protein